MLPWCPRGGKNSALSLAKTNEKFQEGFRKLIIKGLNFMESTAAGNFQNQPVAGMDCAIFQIIPLLDFIRRYIMLPGNGPE